MKGKFGGAMWGLMLVLNKMEKVKGLQGQY